MARREIIIKDTHRGLWYEDGVLTKVLEAGRWVIPRYLNLGFYRRPRIEVALVDRRERDLTIKGQEILTSDKVAIRVSIIVYFQVTDPRAAVHRVASYEDRLYSDVQLAARRSLASMTLEDILTNRNRLSEDILNDLKEVAGSYGVTIFRADVKDLIFPGNLQEIMNRVLAAERMSQVQLVEARTNAEVRRLEAEAQIKARVSEAEALTRAQKIAAQGQADAERIKGEAEIAVLRQRESAAAAYATHPSLLRVLELETLRDLSRSANARIYVDFDRSRVRPPESNEDV
jgi:regulator of protease activity HflC (stomatin/prohibitin superfamily)